MDDPFSGARKKLERAEYHFKELQSLIEQTFSKIRAGGHNPWSYQQEYRPLLHCIVWTITDVQPTNVEWGLIVGDVFNNLRSALDHAAWELVNAGRWPSAKLSEIQLDAIGFPICTTRKAFNEAIRSPSSSRDRRKLPGLRREQLAVIRKVQPYLRPAGAERHPLWAVQYISNRDKHRTVQATGLRPFDLDLTVGAVTDFVPNRKWMPATPIRAEDGAEVLRYYGRRDGHRPHMEVQIRSSIEPEIENRFWLSDAYQFARNLIEALLDRLEPTIR